MPTWLPPTRLWFQSAKSSYLDRKAFSRMAESRDLHCWPYFVVHSLLPFGWHSSEDSVGTTKDLDQGTIFQIPPWSFVLPMFCFGCLHLFAAHAWLWDGHIAKPTQSGIHPTTILSCFGFDLLFHNVVHSFTIPSNEPPSIDA